MKGNTKMTNNVDDVIYILDKSIGTIKKKYFHKNKMRYQTDIACDFVKIFRDEQYGIFYDTIGVGYAVIYIEPDIHLFFSERISVFQHGKLIKEWKWTK